ncbi:hypothetical protein [Sphingomonas sp. HMP6]|uniref:hypothetical protein n=1 Tax=Sphingomonas sp. HMP6 TaxID=1517551 RepID=UPI001596C8E0|nr:hypothetical protein [Sphingomonas sp. HMP6]BCA57666.1 hypothetical protein HMP06_0435 [Sphingomonas sp. HMP6]
MAQVHSTTPSPTQAERAQECLADAYDKAGYRDEAAAFRAGAWTCYDHPAIAAMLAFAEQSCATDRLAVGEVTAEQLARAYDPKLWSDDPTEAHRRASPFLVEALRFKSIADADIVLARITSLTVPERDKDVAERVARLAYSEALTAGWNSGMAREPMDANYAKRAWLASDAAAAIAALRPQVVGEG